MAQLVKNPPTIRETCVRSVGWGDPPGEGKGYPLQYSGLEHPLGCTVLGAAKSQTRLSSFMNGSPQSVSGSPLLFWHKLTLGLSAFLLWILSQEHLGLWWPVQWPGPELPSPRQVTGVFLLRHAAETCISPRSSLQEARGGIQGG